MRSGRILEQACRYNAMRKYIDSHLKVIQALADELGPSIEECAEAVVAALRDGNKLLAMGNGGSAADAQHFAAELVGRFLKDRKALPAIALSTDTSILTAVGNDFGFDEIFRRQVEALARPGDIVFGISTSGNSTNVRQGLVSAREIGCTTVGLLGRDGGDILPVVDIGLTVRSQATPHIQEAHLVIIHLLCAMVEKELF